MKSVLISIQPKWCELIAFSQKTVEVRKTKPKLEVPFKCYIYCTANKQGVKDLLEIHEPNGKIRKANGKVIAEFVCDKIVEFENSFYDEGFAETSVLSCVGWDELALYLGENDFGYGWHISDLVIYDKPKDLSEFHKPCADIRNCLNRAFREAGRSLNKCFDCGCRMQRPPQSWCYIEE